MKKAITFILAAITLLLSTGTLYAVKPGVSQSSASLDASALIVKKGQYVEFSNLCQTNLKRAGFNLSYTRNVQLHDVDEEYNDFIITGIEKTYAKGGILVRLYYSSAKDSSPAAIEISFPTQASRNKFFSTLPKLGFSANGSDTYIAIPTGMCVSSSGNLVEISYFL